MTHHLKTLRARAGLSQAALASLVGITSHTVQSLESGRLGLSESLADRIALATGYDPMTGEAVDREAVIAVRLAATEATLRGWVK